ncbi:hypothetical protein LCGC14_0347620 [marine sediment metagenome]|uniref:Uncharacterized protein n=1 Tax=marine sediment metagenome TaxID=412755 RepID=A0A0F9TBP5_9ZZZZ
MPNTSVTTHLQEDDEVRTQLMEVGKEKRIVHLLVLGDISVFLSLAQLRTIADSIHDYLKPGHHGPEPLPQPNLELEELQDKQLEIG